MSDIADDWDTEPVSGAEEDPWLDMTVTITVDEGEQIECSVLTVFSADGKDYIALLPEDGPDADTGMVYLYRLITLEDGSFDLGNIYDDDEFDAAADAFDEYLDNAEFDELVTEDEFADD